MIPPPMMTISAWVGNADIDGSWGISVCEERPRRWRHPKMPTAMPIQFDMNPKRNVAGAGTS